MAQPILHSERTFPHEKANLRTIESMASALKIIVEGVRPALAQIAASEQLAKYAAFRGRMQEPLTQNDHLLLATAQQAEIHDRPFSYSDVQDLVWEMNGKTMNTQSIYNSLERLLNNNLIAEISSNESSSQMFKITPYGKDVIALSLINEEVRNEAIRSK